MAEINNQSNNKIYRKAESIVQQALRLMGLTQDNMPDSQYKLLVDVLSKNEKLLAWDDSDLAKLVKKECLQAPLLLPNFFLPNRIHAILAVKSNQLPSLIDKITTPQSTITQTNIQFGNLAHPDANRGL